MSKVRDVKKNLLKQGKPKIALGALRDMIQRTQAYYGILNVMLLLITTYTVREATIKKLFPWFNFYWLLGVGVAFIIIVVITDYKFVYPSQIAWHQHEAWKHGSPVRKDFDMVKKHLKKVEKSLGIYEEEEWEDK